MDSLLRDFYYENRVNLILLEELWKERRQMI